VVESLVGRQAELADLEAFLARKGEGPHALFLEGEAGIGKSRLWKEGVAYARVSGMRVLSTHPGGGEVKLAFAGLADLLDDIGLDGLPPPQRKALGVALLVEEPEGAAPDDRAVAAAFRSCLRRLAAGGPLLIAVDDIQWLDPASTRILAFAFRRLAGEPVRLLATVRLASNEREPAEIADALGRDHVDHLPVGPLTVAAIYALVRTRLGVELSRPALLRVHEASRGNPFFALELARALQRQGSEPVTGQPLPVPANLTELVRRRLATLPRPAYETLRLAAPLARPTVAVVERAVGSSDRAARDLDAAAQAGVIELLGDSIRFTHPLLASIHFSSASPEQRRAIHRLLAGVVVDPEEQARHLALWADGPDEAVAARLTDVAERARARGALAAAAELAEQALFLTPAESIDDRHRRLLVAAELRYAAGDTTRARALLEEALQETSQRLERAELLWGLGEITFEGQDTRVGLDFYHRALDEVEGDDLLRGRILASMVFPAFKHEGSLAARSYARDAVAIAERLGDRPTLAYSLARLASLEFRQAFDTDVFERAVALEEELGGLDLDYGPTAEYASALIDAGEHEAARGLLERLCARGRSCGDAAVHQPLVNLAGLEFQAGNWERAEELAREAYDVAIQTGREAAEPKGMFTLAMIEAAQGKCDAARARAEQALVLTDGRGWSSGGPRGALGFLDLSLENYEAAYESLLPAIERYRSLGVPVIFQTFDAAEALAGLGQVPEGLALLERCDEVPAFMRIPEVMTAAARARGLLAAAAGDLVAAEAALEEAVEAVAGRDSPLELGRSLLALGCVQRRLRKKQTARLSLNQALEIFEELGARVWAERSRRELARIGGRSAPRGELSGTETEIVKLVVAGYSNKQVAQALNLSSKTVEWNLSKIYNKLGVHSRNELAVARRASSPQQ
jgi:DNA-binding NarL/FixJ family response regulator